MDRLLTSTNITACGAILCAWLWVSTHNRRNPSRLPLPPGPRDLPLIGLRSIPTSRPWLVYDEWSKTYGDVVYFKFLGQSFLILSSVKAVSDLFDKRSSIYSDRPRMPMIVELMGWDFNATFLPYGAAWRARRRAFHKHFHPGVVFKYQPIQIEETRAFLRKLLESPADYRLHIRQAFAGFIMRIVYGIKVTRHDDPYILTAEEATKGLTIASIPGSFLVDFIPAMKYIPSWFPGASFQKVGEYYKSINTAVIDAPFNIVKENMKNGTALPSIASRLIEELPNDARRQEEEDIAKHTTAVAYLGGADTTSAAIQIFMLAMLIYPDVQRKAQAELDAVVGPNRLPDFSDRPYLPYIDAIVKETVRWQSVTPLGLPHSTSADDEYRGYFIPKGTMVMGNAWALLHDPEVYERPDEFRPERFLKDGKLDPSIRDPEIAGFGFGRRVCPGRHIITTSLWATAASTLATFTLTPPLGDDGKPIVMEARFTDTMLLQPLPFDCVFNVRSKNAEALILDSEHLQPAQA